MSNWLDDAIQKAADDGAFDNLPGQGKPLRLDMRQNLAHRILHDQGETLPWIATRQTLLDEIAAARTTLRRAREWFQAHDHASGAGRYWERACQTFEKTVTNLNARIKDYNLAAPSAQVHLRPLDAARELARIQRDDRAP